MELSVLNPIGVYVRRVRLTCRYMSVYGCFWVFSIVLTALRALNSSVTNARPLQRRASVSPAEIIHFRRTSGFKKSDFSFLFFFFTRELRQLRGVWRWGKREIIYTYHREASFLFFVFLFLFWYWVCMTGIC